MHRVIYQDLPCSIPGYTKMDSEGYYTIILNSRLSSERNRETYDHELKHIQKGDLYSQDNAGEIEELRHKG